MLGYLSDFRSAAEEPGLLTCRQVKNHMTFQSHASQSDMPGGGGRKRSSLQSSEMHPPHLVAFNVKVLNAHLVPEYQEFIKM